MCPSVLKVERIRERNSVGYGHVLRAVNDSALLTAVCAHNVCSGDRIHVLPLMFKTEFLSGFLFSGKNQNILFARQNSYMTSFTEDK
jgi:hypothetical protein